MAYEIEQDTFNSPGEFDTTYVGFKLPFSFGKEDGVLHDNTPDAVKDNLENLFNTEPGERLFHPQLGVNFRKYLFEQIDFDVDDFQAVVQEEVEIQVKRWMPFLAVDKVKIEVQPDANRYRVIVDFHFKNTPSIKDSVEITTAGAY